MEKDSKKLRRVEKSRNFAIQNPRSKRVNSNVGTEEFQERYSCQHDRKEAEQ